MAKKESAEKAVRDIRRKTRRRFSAEEKIRIVIEGLRGGRDRIDDQGRFRRYAATLPAIAAGVHGSRLAASHLRRSG